METKIFDLADKIIVFLFFVQVAILNFLNLSGLGIKIICMFILIRMFFEMLFRGKIHLFTLKNALCLVLIFFVGFLSARFGNNYHKDIFISNILSILYSMIPLIYSSYIINYRYDFVCHIVNHSISIVNFYFVLNMIISCIQVKIPGFMSGISTWENPMHEDLICGLMGYSATPQFGFFSMFVLILNLYYSDFCCAKNKKRHLFRLFSYSIIFFVVIISAFNDNKIVYIELFLFLLFYLYICGRLKSNHKKINKNNFNLLMIIISIIVLLLFLYISLPFVHEKIYNNFMYAVNLLGIAIKSNEAFGYGSADRVYMVIYAFKKFNGFKLGYGMGSYIWHAGNALGFKHFGQADLGSFLCLGGFIFTVSVFSLWMNNYINIVYKKHNKSKIGYISICIFFLLMFFYTQMISMNTINLIIIFCGIVFGIINREMVKRN